MINMRILFIGTPDFAAQTLCALAEAGQNIVGVISQPDKPKGRGHKLMPTEVKAMAENYGYSVYQPESLKDGAIANLLDELKPDIIVVAAYGKLLPEYILNYPRYGCINVHASILPKYRGAAPIQWAIINGEDETGITIMKMEKGLDTGDIIAVEKTKIGEYETAEELFSRLAKIGGELLVRTISDIENAQFKKQDDSHATYAPMIKRETAEIDWTKSNAEITKLICGMNSWPLAWTYYKGEVLKIVMAVKCDMPSNAHKAGEIIELEKGEGMIVAAGDGAVCVKIAQFPNSRKMDVLDYARGHSIEIGEVLGR